MNIGGESIVICFYSDEFLLSVLNTHIVFNQEIASESYTARYYACHSIVSSFISISSKKFYFVLDKSKFALEQHNYRLNQVVFWRLLRFSGFNQEFRGFIFSKWLVGSVNTRSSFKCKVRSERARAPHFAISLDRFLRAHGHGLLWKKQSARVFRLNFGVPMLLKTKTTSSLFASISFESWAN